MNSLAVEVQEARARRVEINEETLIVELVDGRAISVPLAWYPRLWYGTPEERAHFEIIGDGTILHWPDLDEDLSISGILAGRRSGETPESLKKWLEARAGHQRGEDSPRNT
ncbi:MAG TPA: DUF2442 domain-containing protein [Chloroflexi bacterium]|nr:DUF2442 domain-containing protein [Chloroflexota bacterium]